MRYSTFSEASFEKLSQKLTFIPDDATVVAEDESGRSYDYGKEGFSEKKPDISASNWLDLFPDGPDA